MSVHEPVMLREVMERLALRPGDRAVDCTFGGGGYARAMLEATAPDGRVLAIDRDPNAIAAGQVLVRESGGRLTLVHGRFSDLAVSTERTGFGQPRAVVADLGVSSSQLGASDRGFSFTNDGPLDMRFNPTSDEVTAADLVRELSEAELERIIRRYGEEPHARRIAHAIVLARRHGPVATTGALADIIVGVVRRRGRLHPATRTFQALRIAVNDELDELERAIPQMRTVIAPGGRIAIVSFHSLEDRIVKRAFRAAADRGWGMLVTKRPIRPTVNEIARNPRSRSAKLRVIERAPIIHPSSNALVCTADH